MDEDILQPKASNPLESGMLILTALFLLFSIGLSRIEVVEYLDGIPPEDFKTPVEERIRNVYKNDSKLNAMKKKISEEGTVEKTYGFISTETGEVK